MIKRELNRNYIYENTDYDGKTVGILARKIKITSCFVILQANYILCKFKKCTDISQSEHALYVGLKQKPYLK